MAASLDNFDFLESLGPLTVDSLETNRLPTPPILSEFPSDLQPADLILPPLPDIPEIGDFLSKTLSPLPPTTTFTPSFPVTTPSFPVATSSPFPVTTSQFSSQFPTLPATTSFPTTSSSFPTTSQFPTTAKFPVPTASQFPSSQFPVFPSTSIIPQKREHTPEPEKKEKKRRTKSKSIGKVTNQEDRASARRIKHRLIDRARRKRVKDSIDLLKELVRFEPHEKPDKATVVSSAVREIQDLKTQVAQLQAQLAQMTVTASPPSLLHSSVLTPPEGEIPESPEEKIFTIHPGLSDKLPAGFHLPSFLSGLAGAGVVVCVHGMDCRIRDVNGLFETSTGYRREELIGTRFMDAPLFGRNVHGKYPLRFVKSSEPGHALIPTASSSDFQCVDFKRAVSALVNGGTFKVVSRLLTRDGQILESLNTTFLLRNERSEPWALVTLSTPDCRRLINLNHRREEDHEDLFLDLPSLSSPHLHPAFRPFTDEFRTPLATQT